MTIHRNEFGLYARCPSLQDHRGALAAAETEEAGSNFKSHLKTVKKVTTLVAKRGLMAATKSLTFGALDSIWWKVTH